MRRKYEGYIYSFTLADHGGRHIHVFRDNKPLGVYDRIDGAIRGLERNWNNRLQSGLEKFIDDLQAAAPP